MSASVTTCTLSEAAAAIRGLWEVNPHVAVMLWGASGIGKSAMIESFVDKPTSHMADHLADGEIPALRTLRGNSLNPAELNGVLVARGNVADWVSLRTLPDPSDTFRKPRDPHAGIISLDEINLATKSVMGELMQLVYDRRCANYSVPVGYHILAAGNRLEDMAAIQQMNSPLRRRFIHFHVRVDVEEWVDWAQAHAVDPRVVGFIRYRPDLLLQSPSTDVASSQSAEACPRGWERASDVVKAADAAGWPSNLRLAALCGAVGDGAGTEFHGYLRIVQNLPDIDSILAGKNPKITGNDAPAITYAVCAALVSRFVAAKKDAARTKIAQRILDYGSKCLHDDYTVLMVKDLIRVGNNEGQRSVVKAKGFRSWAKAHAGVIV